MKNTAYCILCKLCKEGWRHLEVKGIGESAIQNIEKIVEYCNDFLSTKFKDFQLDAKQLREEEFNNKILGIQKIRVLKKA